MKIGFCLTGSFCTIPKILPVIRDLSEKYEIIPIVSENVYNTDTRFMKKEAIINELKEITKRDVLHTITDCEPIGPDNMCDLLVICPCTGNTAAKLAGGITDTSVTMAFKSHRRCGKNVLIGISSNDALSRSAENIGKLMNEKGVYFIPFSQDDFAKKPYSATFDITLVEKSVESAIKSVQLQPMIQK